MEVESSVALPAPAAAAAAAARVCCAARVIRTGMPLRLCLESAEDDSDAPATFASRSRPSLDPRPFRPDSWSGRESVMARVPEVRACGPLPVSASLRSEPPATTGAGSCGMRCETVGRVVSIWPDRSPEAFRCEASAGPSVIMRRAGLASCSREKLGCLLLLSPESRMPASAPRPGTGPVSESVEPAGSRDGHA